MWLLAIMVVVLVGIVIVAVLVYRSLRKLRSETDLKDKSKNKTAVRLEHLDQYLQTQAPIRFAQSASQASANGLVQRPRTPVGATGQSMPKLSISRHLTPSNAPPTRLMRSNGRGQPTRYSPLSNMQQVDDNADSDIEDEYIDDGKKFDVGEYTEGNFFEQEQRLQNARQGYVAKKPKLCVPKLSLSPRKLKAAILRKEEEDRQVVFQAHRGGRGLDKERDADLTARMMPKYKRYQWQGHKRNNNGPWHTIQTQPSRIVSRGTPQPQPVYRGWINDHAPAPLPTVREGPRETAQRHSAVGYVGSPLRIPAPTHITTTIVTNSNGKSPFPTPTRSSTHMPHHTHAPGSRSTPSRGSRVVLTPQSQSQIRSANHHHSHSAHKPRSSIHSHNAPPPVPIIQMPLGRVDMNRNSNSGTPTNILKGQRHRQRQLASLAEI